MIITLGPDLRIRKADDNWVLEAARETKSKTGAVGTRWLVKGHHTSLDSAFVHAGRHFLSQITGEYATDALPALFALTDEFKRLGQEAVQRMPEVP